MASAEVTYPPNAERIEFVIAQLGNLPTLPAVATRLLQLTTASDSNAKQVIDLVASDQSLTAKILSLARRASVGIGPEAQTVERAVVLMGFRAVRNAVLSIKVFETLSIGPDKRGEGAFDRIEFWKHSLGVACAARLLAKHLRWSVDPEEAFVCGLLHDLGKVALDTCLPKSFARVVRLAVESHGCIADFERKLIGIDHTTAGRRLAQRWQLPDTLADVLWLHHHRPDALPQHLATADMIKIVHLADTMVREQRIGFSGNFVYLARAADLAGQFGLSQTRFSEILEQLPAQIRERSSIIGLADITSERLYTRAMAQANEELGRLNDSLTVSNRVLQRRAGYFQALASMTNDLSPQAAVTDVCLAGANAIRTALELPAVLICSSPDDRNYCHLAVTDGHTKHLDIFESGQLTEIDNDSPGAGASWISPALPQVQPLLARFAQQLGQGPYWLVRIVCHNRLVAHAAFCASPEKIQQHSVQSDDLAALSAALGLAIANARVRGEAQKLAEDLAQTNQQLQQIQSQLLRTRSLQAIAEMAAGAAHELNTPLAVISGRAQQLGDRTADPQVKQVLATIDEQAHRCSQIVTDLMDFARPTPPQPVRFRIETLLQELRSDCLKEADLSPDQFLLDISPDLPEVYADPSHVRQIIQELTANALQSSSADNLSLTVNCRSDLSDNSIVVVVEDNGCGMSPEILTKAFDPFFSHQRAGRRRGLGLARAHCLAESNLAKLWLESRPEVGTTAYLRLPVAAAVQPERQAVG